MDRWAREFKQAVRRLMRAPLFSLTVFSVIAAAVAFGSAMSGLARATLQQALPYPDGDRLVRFYEFSEIQDVPQMESSLPSVRVWATRTHLLESLGVVRAPMNVTVETNDGTMRVLAGLADPEIFTTLGVEPAQGRGFGPDEGTLGSATTSVVLSHEFWTRLFGGDPGALGGTLTIGGTAWTVVGVLPPRIPLSPVVQEPIDVWFPARSDRDPPRPGPHPGSQFSSLQYLRQASSRRPRIDDPRGTGGRKARTDGTVSRRPTKTGTGRTSRWQTW